jgi:hypothetical protein
MDCGKRRKRSQNSWLPGQVQYVKQQGARDGHQESKDVLQWSTAYINFPNALYRSAYITGLIFIAETKLLHQNRTAHNKKLHLFIFR